MKRYKDNKLLEEAYGEMMANRSLNKKIEQLYNAVAVDNISSQHFTELFKELFPDESQGDAVSTTGIPEVDNHPGERFSNSPGFRKIQKKYRPGDGPLIRGSNADIRY